MLPHDFIPIAAMATSLIGTSVLVWGVVRILRGPVGQAWARRINGNVDHPDHLEDEVLELRDAVAGLADELRETNERLDFTERLLAASPERGREEVEADTTGGG